ncbi:BTB/POZ domain-containing protein 6-B-like [Bradysia coprophila]|uniref:BTB/POZ domain-containing protein 6-B-like n=1 Tax=Bradysia coprophila TaxID=38358 RepID=UPI00187D8760|nr:BTB/POZ domain-containing protein 6-B-like [Bradysia coprophila]
MDSTMSSNSTCDSASGFENSPIAGTAVINKRKAPVGSEFCKRSCSKLYLEEETADVHFAFNADGVECKIPAHKYMLAIGSPVFDAMFYGELKEMGNVTITDCTAESFKEFLQFFYLDHVELTVTNGPEVMYLIHKYGTSECFPICERFLAQNFTMEMVGWILEQTMLFNRIGLRKFVLNRIMNETEEYFQSDAFINCTPELLKMVLELERFNVREHSVFYACIAWSRNACVTTNADPNMSNLRHHLGDCFHLIQFAAMSRNEISGCISKYGQLFTHEELIEIINITTLGDRTKLTYFVGNSRVRSVEWSVNASMVFSPRDFAECSLRKCETGLFRTNTNILLGAVATQPIVANTKQRGKLFGILKIIESDVTSETSDFFVLTEQPFFATYGDETVPTNFTQLVRPIVIERKKVYTIRIEFDSSWVDGKFTTREIWDNQYVSIRDYKVLFQSGFVSHLYCT